MATRLGLSLGVAFRRKRRTVIPDLVPGIIEQDLTAWTQTRLTTATATLPATLAESTDVGDTTHEIHTEPVQANGNWIFQADVEPLADRYFELRGNTNLAIMRVNHVALTVAGTGTGFVSGSVIALGSGVFRATLRFNRTTTNRVIIRANADAAGAFYQGDGRDAIIVHAVGLNAA